MCIMRFQRSQCNVPGLIWFLRPTKMEKLRWAVAREWQSTMLGPYDKISVPARQRILQRVMTKRTALGHSRYFAVRTNWSDSSGAEAYRGHQWKGRLPKWNWHLISACCTLPRRPRIGDVLDTIFHSFFPTKLECGNGALWDMAQRAASALSDYPH